MRTPTLVALRALKLGDLVTATPALRALARAFPLHRRVLAAPRYLRPVVALTAAVDEVVDTGELEPIDRSLSRPAVAVNLHGRGPRSTELLEDLGPERLIAFGDDWRAEEHEVHRWCRLLREAGIPADPNDRHLRVPPVPVPDFACGATLLHPGASAPARRWPAERFAEVARAEACSGRVVIVTGDESEEELAHEVAARGGVPAAHVLAGRTSLAQLAATVAAAGRVCSNDTGVAHLATAFGTPSVVLFGPVPPSLWGPPADEPRHIALWAGRRGDPHGDRVDPALLRITVDEVLAALARLDRYDADARAATAVRLARPA